MIKQLISVISEQNAGISNWAQLFNQSLMRFFELAEKPVHGIQRDPKNSPSAHPIQITLYHEMNSQSQEQQNTLQNTPEESLIKVLVIHVRYLRLFLSFY